MSVRGCVCVCVRARASALTFVLDAGEWDLSLTYIGYKSKPVFEGSNRFLGKHKPAHAMSYPRLQFLHFLLLTINRRSALQRLFSFPHTHTHTHNLYKQILTTVISGDYLYYICTTSKNSTCIFLHGIFFSISCNLIMSSSCKCGTWTCVSASVS